MDNPTLLDQLQAARDALGVELGKQYRDQNPQLVKALSAKVTECRLAAEAQPDYVPYAQFGNRVAISRQRRSNRERGDF